MAPNYLKKRTYFVVKRFSGGVCVEIYYFYQRYNENNKFLKSINVPELSYGNIFSLISFWE